MINRMQKWIYIIILLTGYSIKSYTQETINLNIPVEQNWMFDNEHPVRFMLELTSAQSGFSDRIRMDIATDFGNAVSSTFITYSFGTDSIAPRWRLSQSCISHSHESHSRVLPGLFHCRHRHSETFLLWIRSRTDFIQTGWPP